MRPVTKQDVNRLKAAIRELADAVNSLKRTVREVSK